MILCRGRRGALGRRGGGLIGLGGQREVERRAETRLARTLHPNSPPVQFDEALGDGQPQAGALFTIGGVLRLPELFKDGGLRGGRNAAPRYR